MLYLVHGGKQFPVLRNDYEVLRRKNNQILKRGMNRTSSSLDPLSRDRSVVSWKVKCVELGEIHFYISMLLDNSKFHIHYFILFETPNVMIT